MVPKELRQGVLKVADGVLCISRELIIGLILSLTIGVFVIGGLRDDGMKELCLFYGKVNANPVELLDPLYRLLEHELVAAHFFLLLLQTSIDRVASSS